MKTFLLIVLMVFCSFASVSFAESSPMNQCNAQVQKKGGDAWPWSVAQPFPWDNIGGFWQIGQDDMSFIKATVLSSNNKRKILSLSLYGEGICSKPFARGTGYIDYFEKNVVRALVSDGVYRYQLKLGMFDSRDLADVVGGSCRQNLMAISMQVIGHAPGREDGTEPLDPGVTETHNLLLKKVAIEPDSCRK